MALFGSLKTLQAQVAQPERFRAGFAHIEECFRQGSDAHARLLALAPGKTQRTELDGGAFALEQVYYSKSRPEGFFESHRAYIDIQAIISGEEFIEVLDISRISLKEDRTPTQDVLIYEMAPVASALRMTAGDVALLFPVDGHMGGVVISQPTVVRKVVIKVPVG